MSSFIVVEKFGKHEFISKTGDQNFFASCFSVNFHKLIKTGPQCSIDPLVDDRDILHSIVSLYHTCLPNIDPDVLYTTICDKNSRTLLLLLSPETALEQLCIHHKLEPEVDKKPVSDKTEVVTRTDVGCSESSKGEFCEKYFIEKLNVSRTAEEEEKATESCPNCKSSKYSKVFSDEEDNGSDDDSSDECNNEQLSVGFDQFLTQVAKRRHNRKKYSEQFGKIRLSSVDIESRLIGAITWERSFEIPSERICHITVLSIRKRFRKFGLGQFLVDEVKRVTSKDHSCETLAVLSDADAVKFFEKQNFTRDKMICSRYECLIDSWTDCVVMIYIPSFFDAKQADADLKLNFVDKEADKLQEYSIKVYQNQFGLISRLKNEVIATRKIVEMQKQVIISLTKEVANKNETEKQIQYTGNPK